MHLFYTPDIEHNTQNYLLNEQESKHCTRVLRLQVDDKIVLMDGRGYWYDAHIMTIHKNQVVVHIEKKYAPYPTQKHDIHIAVAPTKNIDRYEWFLEKATEIGINSITPIICERSERKEVKTDRLEKIITAAVKQSLKSYHPEIKQTMSFKNFIAQDFSNYQERWIAHCAEDSTKNTIPTTSKKDQSYLVLIGPEGDFSNNEVALAKAKGFETLSLGKARLRTETAALFACFQLNQLQW